MIAIPSNTLDFALWRNLSAIIPYLGQKLGKLNCRKQSEMWMIRSRVATSNREYLVFSW